MGPAWLRERLRPPWRRRLRQALAGRLQPTLRRGLRQALAGMLIAAAVATGCQRPFEEPARPQTLVLDPDLTVIQSDKQIELAVRVLSGIPIEHVVAGEDTLAYDEGENAWRGEQVLTGGLNRIVLAITDAEMRTTLDTVYAMQDVLTAARSMPDLLEPRGGHTTTRVADGTIYLFGGARTADGPAQARNMVWRRGGASFAFLEDELNVARIGHTATLMPDGRILILGGALRDGPLLTRDVMVETVEIFDPRTERFTALPVEGTPVRRMYHTAVLLQDDGAVFVDVYGGRDASSTGARADVRRFRVEAGRLVALDPAPGPELDERLAGHTQVELFPDVAGNPRFLISGALFTETADRNVSFELEYRPDVGLLQFPAGGLLVPRTQHAAALLGDGFVGHFGGRQESTDHVLNSIEIYSSVAKGTFRYRETALLSRFGHTATKLPNQRILLLGGFRPSGDGTALTELYRVPDLEEGTDGS